DHCRHNPGQQRGRQGEAERCPCALRQHGRNDDEMKEAQAGDDRHEREQQRPAGFEHELVADVLDGIETNQRQEQAECEERGNGRLAECALEVRSGGGLVRHSHTFSTSGRPRMPCGRKIITIARIEKAATSLYALDTYSAHSVSMMPMSKPPSTAPGSEPMPPRTAAVNAFTPGTKPSSKRTTP